MILITGSENKNEEQADCVDDNETKTIDVVMITDTKYPQCCTELSDIETNPIKKYKIAML